MGDAESSRPSLNPLLLQLQKMELELKCLQCFELLKTPILMPCDHIFCCYCIATFTETLRCPVCLLRCLHRDVKPATHVEKMVIIYKNLKTIVDANLSIGMSDIKMYSGGSPVLGSKTTKEKAHEEMNDNMPGTKLDNAPLHATLSGNLSRGNPKADSEIRAALHESKKLVDDAGQEASTDQGGETYSYSPPSSGNIKDSDNDSNAQVSKCRAKKSAAKRLPTENLEVENKDKGAGNMTELKRQKLISTDDGGDTRLGNALDSFILKSKSENKDNCASIHLLQNSSSSATNALVECAFCHSFRTTEFSGEMLHYINGEPVGGTEAFQPNVVHVHRKCIDWAPQIYFEGETAMNMGPELSRALKIKCSRCGQKGAALGCYVKNCRKSYHVPCAVKTLECRWDCDNYLVLCPSHSEHRLPCDKSKKKRRMKSDDSLDCVDTSQVLTSGTTEPCDERLAVSPRQSREMVFCGSSLSREGKGLLDKFASSCGATVTSTWKETVTHVIASTDENGACSRTLKFLMAILNGTWVLKSDWIKASMEAGHPVPEEPYEIRHDVHGFFDGPRTGRLKSKREKTKLFTGFSFYLSDEFDPCYKGYLEDLVTAGGGIVKNKSDFILTESSDAKDAKVAFVVYSSDPPGRCNFTDLNEVIQKRAKDAETFAAKTGAQAIPHTRLLDTIAACNLQQL